jgi:hypothetical protein
MDPKFLTAIQFWNGDMDDAVRLARFLADLERSHSQYTDLLMISRFDCDLDTSILPVLARSFNVHHYKSRRRATGWPAGCNELWSSTIEWFSSMAQYRKIPHYKAIFTCEADGGPLSRDWAKNLSEFWDKAGKAVVGPLVFNPGEHINGNAMFTGDQKFLKWVLRRASQVSPYGGWDYVLAPEFKKLGWADNPTMKSYYASKTFTLEQYNSFRREGLNWIHGIKDDSLIRYGREQLILGRL